MGDDVISGIDPEEILVWSPALRADIIGAMVRFQLALVDVRLAAPNSGAGVDIPRPPLWA
jgi:hypothetical protein